MSQEFGFIGWNTEGTSDKIWGYFFRPTPGIDNMPYWRGKDIGRNIVIFWGRRGKTMAFKAGVYDHEIGTLMSSKIKKGYISINETKLLAIWPTFIQEAEAKLMWEVLAGKVK